MKKRVFSAALAGCMMLTMIPVTAFAAEEGVTEVSVEQYAAKAPTLEVVGFTDGDYKTAITSAGVDWEAAKFMNEKKELIPVVDLAGFTNNTDPGGVALKSGYYVPLKLTAYGADADTTVVLKDGEPVNYDDPYASRQDKTITHDKFDAWSSETVKGSDDGHQDDRKDVHYILVHVARLDGKLKQSTFTVEIYPDGEDRTAEEDVQTVSFDLTDLTLVPSEYMKAEKLEPCADAKKTIIVSSAACMAF